MSRLIIAFCLPLLTGPFLRAADPDPKDDKIGKALAQAKADYITTMKTASTTLAEAFEPARLKVAASNLSDDQKLKALELLTKEKDAFDASSTRPKSAEMRPALQRFDETA